MTQNVMSTKRGRLPSRQAVMTLGFAIGNLYIIALVLFLAGKWLIGEQWEAVAFGNSFVQLLILPAFVWLIVSLLRRRWSFTGLSLVPVLFFIASYGVLFWPRSVNEPSAAARLKILTYNIHSEQENLDPMIALIQTADADVVAVQELSAEAAQKFDVKLSAVYPYRAFHTTRGEPVIGQGVLSRYPIQVDAYWRNDELPVRLGHQRVEIDVNGVRVTLYNTHPIHPMLKVGHVFYTALRTAEIDSVLQRAEQDRNAVIIVGDFNMSDQSEDYRRITAHYADAYRELGWGLGFTFPDFSSANAVPGNIGPLPIRPIVRLDYVFHNEKVAVEEIRVWPNSGGSDHRPIFARLALVTGLSEVRFLSTSRIM